MGSMQKTATLRRPLNWIIAPSRESLPLWASVALGVALLTALSKIALPIPGSPVPVTGQTFGIALIALLWGRKRAMTTVASYLLLGFSGAPVFAGPVLPFTLGPTSGYLVGMFFSSAWVGWLSDRGWSRSLWRALIAAETGSLIIFAFGLGVLSTFVPSEHLLAAGWIPFIPGDVLKTTLAAWVASRRGQQREQS